MDKEEVKERIRFYTELLKLLWVLLIALGGGLSSLFLKGIGEPKSLSISFVGLTLFVIVLLGVIRVIRDIHRLLKKLEDIA